MLSRLITVSLNEQVRTRAMGFGISLIHVCTAYMVFMHTLMTNVHTNSECMYLVIICTLAVHASAYVMLFAYYPLLSTAVSCVLWRV
jgi:hypothetical protein